ncbi:integrase arm-type DNA-binding domain-containing protein [Methylomarinum vadi]|uniref:integrase arm-type DNA-binding domain-containing protein n=1 Tax=Methylomarinum vadi TaxID=438855 RepID=UPI0013630CBA|nr:integrase arm-type DNA-binding domain-containing protein [Methylomarinum vadi]
MAEKINFTQQRIENLPSPGTGRTDYYDTTCPKLTCRVSNTGNKSFVVLKKNEAGKVQRITLGRFPDISVSQARKLAIETLSELADGIDPIEEKRKKRYQAITLQQLFDIYLEDKPELREASKLDYSRKLRQGFSDWLNKPINEVTRDMVKARRNSFTGGRDNKMRVLRLLMTYAYQTLKAIEENPVDILKEGKLWAKAKRKKRMIPSDSLKDWYEAVLSLDNEKAKVYLLLLLHTGLRDQDIRYLEWKDVDFKNDCFVARDTKNHTDFTAYIAPQVKPYLRNLQSLTGNDRYMFPGETKDGVMGIPRKPITQVCKQTGIEFSSHDLKRTFLTIGEAAMIPFSLLKALANHKTDGDVTGGYINPEAKTMKAATFKIADYIHQHTAPANDNVITLKSSGQ